MAEITSMSRGQKNYLQKLRRDSQIVRLIRILIFLVFLALWEAAQGWGSSTPLSFPAFPVVMPCIT